jgi:hypothetical protein
MTIATTLCQFDHHTSDVHRTAKIKQPRKTEVEIAFEEGKIASRKPLKEFIKELEMPTQLPQHPTIKES